MDKSIKEKVKDKKDNKIQTIGVKNNDTNKRLIVVNDKKGCTQTAYVGSLVTMLVLHDPWMIFFSSPNSCLYRVEWSEEKS